MCADNYLHVLSAHMRNDSIKLSASTIEQGDGLARLHAQDLHMTRSCRRQANRSTGVKRLRAIKAWHLDVRLQDLVPMGCDGRG